MNEWLHIGFEAALIWSSLALSFYSFRLHEKFFKGGLFDLPFRIFGFASLLFAAAYTFDLILDLTGLSTAEYELAYYVLNLSFVVVLSYGIHTLYRAWTKLGTP